MTPHDARLVPAALAAYATAAAVVIGARWWVCVLGCMVLAVLAWRCRRRAGAVLLLAAVVAMTVAGVGYTHLDARDSGGLAEQVEGGAVDVRATAVREPQPVSSPSLDGSSRVRVVLDVTAWAPSCHCEAPPPDAWHRADARIAAFLSAEDSTVGFGDTLTLRGTLSETRPGRDLAVMWDGRVLEVTGATGWRAQVADLRDGLRAATAHLPEHLKGLTRGMVVGDTSAMPPEQAEAMRVTSLTHLTAVSGAHFAIVLMATAGLLRWWGWHRRLRAVLAVAVMIGFALLVFPEPSVVRALTMALAVCAALWWGRRPQALPALSAGVIALVLVDPYLTLSYGFALSVTAVAALVCWAPVLAVSLQRWLAPSVAKAVAIPIAAQVACAPILVLFMPGVGTYGVAANLIAAVCAVPVTLVGLAAVVLGPVNATLAALTGSMAGAAATPIAWVAQTLAEAPGSWWAWPQGAGGAVAMAVVSIGVISASVARETPRRWRVAALAVSALTLVATPAIDQWGAPRQVQMDDWSVAVCDVGQGHMMMLRAALDQAVVIDVGAVDAGAVECLDRHGVRGVPLLVLTHPHADHDGAVADVLEHVPVGQAWVSPATTRDGHAQAVQELAEGGVTTSVAARGDAATVGRATVTVWHPERGSDDGSWGVNDASVVVTGASGQVRVANLGDLERQGQRALIRALPPGLDIDVVMVAHHGSASQHPALIDAIDATVAVVGVGEGNRHGHPDSGALELYARHGATVVRTDQCGDAVIARRESLVLAAGCRLPMAG